MGRQIKHYNSLLPRSCRDMLSIVESLSKQNSIEFCFCKFILRCPVVTSTKGVLFNFRSAYHILFCFRNFVSEWDRSHYCRSVVLVMTTYSWQIIFKRNICNTVIFSAWIFFVDIRFVEIIILSPPWLVLVFISSRFTLPLLPILSPFKNGFKQSRKKSAGLPLGNDGKTLV